MSLKIFYRNLVNAICLEMCFEFLFFCSKWKNFKRYLTQECLTPICHFSLDYSIQLKLFFPPCVLFLNKNTDILERFWGRKLRLRASSGYLRLCLVLFFFFFMRVNFGTCLGIFRVCIHYICFIIYLLVSNIVQVILHPPTPPAFAKLSKKLYLGLCYRIYYNFLLKKR